MQTQEREQRYKLGGPSADKALSFQLTGVVYMAGESFRLNKLFDMEEKLIPVGLNAPY